MIGYALAALVLAWVVFVFLQTNREEHDFRRWLDNPEDHGD